MAKLKEKYPVDDALKTYFDQIKSIPLLSFEEELALSKLIQKGDKAALQKLIESNLKLVITIAKAYVLSDVPLLDLIQEGNLGLMLAAEKYDYKKNVRFSTYANWWIKQAISRSIAKKRRTIRLPQRKEDLLRKIQRTEHYLRQALMRKPSSEEIAAEIGCSPREVNMILNLANNMLSLEMDSSEHEDDVVGIANVYEDYTYSPERAFLKQSIHEDTLRHVNRLKDRERKVLTYRFLLNNDKRYTLKKVGDKLGISPETVRQIEIKALRKMRLDAEELRDCFKLEAI